MRPSSSDPDVRKYDREDEWVACPECRSWMLPLSKYEIQKSSASPTVGAEPWEFFLWGWWAFVYNFIYDLATYEGRKRKLAQQKQEILPKFPNSLVCPRCLHVVKRP
jgi:hypothetical protein